MNEAPAWFQPALEPSLAQALFAAAETAGILDELTEMCRKMGEMMTAFINQPEVQRYLEDERLRELIEGPDES